MSTKITRTNNDGTTTTITLYNWIEARKIAKSSNGTYIRRYDWKKWLYIRSYVWQIYEDVESAVTRRVAQNYDFSVGEFRAYDWTTEPWDTTKPNPVPPVDPEDPEEPENPETPEDPGTVDPVEPWDFPPAPSPPGGGGGGGGGDTPSNPGGPGGTTDGGSLTVTVGIISELNGKDGECYQWGESTGSADLNVSISTSGPKGLYMLSVTCEGRTQLGTAYNGFTGGFMFRHISFVPGGSVTVSATISQSGNTASGSATYQGAGYCCDFEMTPEHIAQGITPLMGCWNIFYNEVGNTRTLPNGNTCVTCSDYMCMDPGACLGHMEPYTDSHGVTYDECVCVPDYIG